jgi:hypothetical protein
MSWGRLHDGANADPKLLALSDSAWRMWGCGLIYCQNALTDGFIPEHAIHTFGVRAKNKEAVAAELCRTLIPGKGALWHKVDGGYQVHDYLDWNDSRTEVLEGRARGRDRVRRHRAARAVTQAVVNLVTDSYQEGREAVLARPPRTAESNSHSNSGCNAFRSACSNADGNAVSNADGNAVGNSGSTYHVPQYEKQERGPSPPISPDAVENTESGPDPRILGHRRRRSKETDDGQPKVSTIAALARDVLLRHPSENDDGALREILKRACAKANLRYDGRSVAAGLDLARAQVKRGLR